MSSNNIPEAGTKAPKFKCEDQNGNVRTLAEFKGKKLVLYFYPQDDTPTCTKEACDLRDNYKRLMKAGYSILGVSPDKAAKHQKFIKKYNLPFDLLVDTDLTVVNAYGVWAEKMMFGRKYMGVLRTSFIINEKGMIEEVITKVESANHSAQILG